MVKDETQSVRISKAVVKLIKMHTAYYGGTIRSVLEKGAGYAMGEEANKAKSKKK